MKEEDFLKQKFGKKNPFAVPDNYFEELTDKVMSQLPDPPAEKLQLEPSRWQKLKPWVYMAAMFVGAALIIKVVSFSMQKNEVHQLMHDDAAQCQYIENLVDEAMLSDYELYELSEDMYIDEE